MKRTAAAIAAFPLAIAVSACTTHEGAHGDHAPRLGTVNFPVECNATAQREFNTAMAYYHSFAWAQLQEPLERTLKADPTCGMAHWLRVLASLDNPFLWPGGISQATLAQGSEILDTARKTGLKSQRERDYVDALDNFFKDHAKLDHRTRVKALETSLERVMQRYPQDKEAAILYALVLSANFDPTDRKYTNQLKAAQVLEPIFKQQPQHPGVAHYLIHSYDYPADREARDGRGEALQRDRAGRRARAAHAVAHLHARGRLEGVDRVQPRVGARRGRQGVRQVARLRLHGVRASAARPGPRGPRRGARSAGQPRTGRPSGKRLRLCGHAGAPGARARGVEGGRGAAALRGRQAFPGRSTPSPRRSTRTRAESAPR